MLRKLIPYTKGYRMWILAGILCSVAESVLELLLPQAMSNVVDVGIASGDSHFILMTGVKMLLLALAAMAGGVGAARKEGDGDPENGGPAPFPVAVKGQVGQ